MRIPTLAAALAAAAALQHTPPRRHHRTIRHTSKKHSGTRQRPKGAGRVRQGGKRGDLLKGIYDAPAITKEGPSVAEDPLLPFVEALARAACGRSRPQCDAVAAAVVDDAKELYDRVPN